MKFIAVLFVTVFSFVSTQSYAQTKHPFHHPKGKYIEVNGAKLWVETEGKGLPLFLISGGPGSAHTYMHSFDTLRDHHLLVFIDGFGRGKSDVAKNVKEYSIARDVSDVDGVRKALGFDKISILGHSYGTVVAQQYAVDHPKHMNKLIIADGFFSGKMWQENCDNANHEIEENYPEVWDSLLVLRSEGLQSSDPACIKIYGQVPYGFMYAYNPNKFLHSSYPPYPNSFNTKLYYQLVGPDGDFIVGNDIRKFDVTKDLKNLKMPILILAGRFDRVSVPKFAVRYKKLCPQATFVMFEKSGHNPMIEQPKKTFAVIRKFLGK